LQILEENILSRIKDKKFHVDNDFKIEKSRTFQLIEILRRVKTEEMIKLKFLPNFSVSPDTTKLVTQKLYFLPPKEVKPVLDTIPFDELVPLYVYIKMCSDILAGRKIHKGKS
jgi:hypothetical protein